MNQCIIAQRRRPSEGPCKHALSSSSSRIFSSKTHLHKSIKWLYLRHSLGFELSVTVSVGEILESVPSCLGKYIPSKNRFVVSNSSGFGDHIIVFKKLLTDFHSIDY